MQQPTGHPSELLLQSDGIHTHYHVLVEMCMAEPLYIGQQLTRTPGVSQFSLNTQGQFIITHNHLIKTVLFFNCSIVMGDINPRDNEGMTPVHCAAQLGRAKHILLLNEGQFNSSIYTLQTRKVAK